MKMARPHIDEWGIASAYQDAFGKQRTVSVHTVALIRKAMAAQPNEDPRKTGDDFENNSKPGQHWR